MSKQAIKKAVLFAGTFALTLTPMLATVAEAQAQGGYSNSNGPPPPGYEQQQPNYPPQGNDPQQGYQQPDNGQNGYNGQNGGPDGGPNGPPPHDMPPPRGYDGTRPPPPPPGYDPGPGYAAQQQADQRYAYEAEQWSRQYCVKAHGNAGTGAIIGGIFGAILGGGLSGRHSSGAGVFAGAAVGAAGGAVIAGSSGSNATSPGCPPGYVVRGGAPGYAYAAPSYYYAAPGWYRPWVFIDGAWAYRPYPYHDWYYRRYHGGWGGRGGYHDGYRGDRPGY